MTCSLLKARGCEFYVAMPRIHLFLCSSQTVTLQSHVSTMSDTKNKILAHSPTRSSGKQLHFVRQHKNISATPQVLLSQVLPTFHEKTRERSKQFCCMQTVVCLKSAVLIVLVTLQCFHTHSHPFCFCYVVVHSVCFCSSSTENLINEVNSTLTRPLKTKASNNKVKRCTGSPLRT